MRRTVSDRQRIVRETLAGRECQLSAKVPSVRTTLLVVMMRIGGKESVIQKGVTSNIRMKRLVSAGLVVAEVAVRCVDRKSVSCKQGSSIMLHLVVRIDRVSTISSKVFWCFMLLPSEGRLLWPFCFSPVQPVEDKGEYLRANIPNMRPTISKIGPVHLMMLSPYSTIAQNPAIRRKLSQGSPLDHDSSPAALVMGSMKGWEKASARVTVGGVATSRGDFRWTRMVERCFVAD